MIVDSLHWFILNFWILWLLPLFWLLLFLLLLFLLLWASHRLLTSILPILLWRHLYDYLLNLYLRVLHHRSSSSSSNSIARHDSLAPPLSSTTTFNRCNSLILVPRHQNTLATNI